VPLFAITRHIRNISIAAVLGALLASSAVTTAAADPIADKQAEAAAIQDQLEAINSQISALGEQYNGAILRLQAAEARLAEVQGQVDATAAEVDRITALVHQRAASIYRQTLSGRSLDVLDAEDASDLLKRQRYAATQADHDDRLLDDLATAKAELERQRGDAQQARDDADAERARIEQTKTTLDARSDEQQALLTKVQGEIAQLVQQEMDRRQAEALAAARGQYGDVFDPNLPPPSPATQVAIEYAKAQIGKTYVYAAAGPDHFDCSGLVMAAFRSAGVSLPHYSGAQYAMLPHVPLNNMQPGDLVFWGRGGSTHVAIYLGGARIIESGGSGHDTHIGAIWGHPSGAARVV
jgi:cell wall-associated NlpC family hydrolase